MFPYARKDRSDRCDPCAAIVAIIAIIWKLGLTKGGRKGRFDCIAISERLYKYTNAKEKEKTSEEDD